MGETCHFLFYFISCFNKFFFLSFYLLHQFLVCFHHCSQCLNTPIMELISKHLLESRLFIEEHAVFCFVFVTLILFINVVLRVYWFWLLFKCKSFYAFITSIENNSFIDWSWRQNIFHSSNYLKPINIELLGVCDCSGTESVFNVIFLQESPCNINELEVIEVL